MDKAIKKEDTFDWFWSQVKDISILKLDEVPNDLREYPWFLWMIQNHNGSPLEAFLDYQAGKFPKKLS